MKKTTKLVSMVAGAALLTGCAGEVKSLWQSDSSPESRPESGIEQALGAADQHEKNGNLVNDALSDNTITQSSAMPTVEELAAGAKPVVGEDAAYGVMKTAISTVFPGYANSAGVAGTTIVVTRDAGNKINNTFIVPSGAEGKGIDLGKTPEQIMDGAYQMNVNAKGVEWAQSSNLDDIKAVLSRYDGLSTSGKAAADAVSGAYMDLNDPSVCAIQKYNSENSKHRVVNIGLSSKTGGKHDEFCMPLSAAEEVGVSFTPEQLREMTIESQVGDMKHVKITSKGSHKYVTGMPNAQSSELFGAYLTRRDNSPAGPATSIEGDHTLAGITAKEGIYTPMKGFAQMVFKGK